MLKMFPANARGVFVRVIVRELDTKATKTVLLKLPICADFIGPCWLACVGLLGKI